MSENKPSQDIEIGVEAEFGGETVGTAKQFIIYFLVNAVIGVALWFILQNTKQTIASTIFVALVIGTLMFWRFRVALAFLGIVALLLTGTIDLSHTIEFMSTDVILFLVGMMVMVGILRRSGFFRWLLAKAMKLSGFHPTRLFIMILAMAAIMAALVDEVTSILFISALTLDLCEYYKVKPVNYIISVVLATNVGSSWTVLGNPIGIMIALRSGLTFEDFIKVAMPIGIISLIFLIAILIWWQRKDLKQLKEQTKATSIEQQSNFLNEWAKVADQKMFRGSAIIFGSVIVLLALHYRMELALQLEHNTLLVAIAIAGAGVVMLWKRSMAQDLIMKDVDWWTLIFFMFLFAKAGCLKYVGVTDRISEGLMVIGGGNSMVLSPIMLWLSGITSSVLDNVLVVATMAPIVQTISASLGSPILWWAMLFGGCYGGNITMVGSTANIVSLGILERRSGYHMTFMKWIGIGLLGGLIPMVISTLLLMIWPI
ncbi:MAG: SLC13 family permease [Dehalococcoidales bacterium]|nr:SLC13 family permease [Dehalococcoidales bacterium]